MKNFENKLNQSDSKNKRLTQTRKKINSLKSINSYKELILFFNESNFNNTKKLNQKIQYYKKNIEITWE